MTATVDVEPEAGSADGDAVLGYLSQVLAAMGGLAAGASGVGDAARIDRISLLEQVKAAVSAAQSPGPQEAAKQARRLAQEADPAGPIRHLDHITPWRDGGPTAYANAASSAHATTTPANSPAGRSRPSG